ncbi:DNA methyltransferase [Acinetobacter pittii]|uniref:DNA methyltransferase n=1 Tax=Acinetobacter pittii TaxID=48296 RepID=UPI002A6AB5AB|nr:DNA methyltransferase [Acinetobacter pittii]WPP70224.1 DNA methyltransferase [Acinetobacter pittii]
MIDIAKTMQNTDSTSTTALEAQFPIVEISQIAEQESWRKEINRPIYHIHKWWATRLGSVFRAITIGALTPPNTNIWEEFYKTHNLKDKVVLDPFMGSGTSVGEALKLGAKAIGNDINPISTFLVRQAFTPVPEADLQAAFEYLEERVAPKIRHYYQTRDPLTGEKIPVLYYFWVKTVTTPDNEVIPLFSRYVFSQDAYPKKKPKAQIVCPNCWEVLEDRYDATELCCKSCAYIFNPQKGPASGQNITVKDGTKYKIKDLIPKNTPPKQRMYALMALRKDGSKIYLKATQEDFDLYDEADKRLDIENLPLPQTEVRPGHNTDQARGYNYTKWRDFFNSRQLLCLGLLLKEILNIKNQIIQEQILCLFSSTLEFNNLFCSFKGEGTGAVRHMFSNHILKPERTPLENSIWGTNRSSGTFSTLFESRLLRAKRYLDTPFDLEFKYDMFGERIGSNKIIVSNPITAQRVENWEELKLQEHGVLILNGDSSKLPLPEKTVDAVITDPPYFDFVHYSELSDFFFAWLSPVLRDRYDWMSSIDSSHPGEVQHNDPKIFSNQLSSVFSEACRVLKDEGILAFSFHHSRAEGWAAIYEAINKSGLAIVTAHAVHAEQRSASPKTSAKEPISIDAILVCRKKRFATNHFVSMAELNTIIEKTSVQLQNGGMKISNNDKFVISAAQTLISYATHDLSYDEIKKHLENVRILFNS